mgnify:FL=1
MPASESRLSSGQSGGDIVIVMVGTTHPGNIGAAARVMANMGLARLRLVSPRLFPHPDAVARAAGAETVLESVEVFDSLEAAVGDCQCVIGTTARRRSISWPLVNSHSAAQLMLETVPQANCAVVFGTEASGLSNEELDLCTAHMHIDVDPSFPSLNVATAVAIVAYEIRSHSLDTAPEPSVVVEANEGAMTMGEFSQLMTHFESVLDRTGFLIGPTTKLLRKLRRALLRGVQTREEINILRGVLTSIDHSLSKDRSRD